VTPYLAWGEVDPNTLSSRVRVSHLSSGAWTTPIDLNVDSNRSATEITLTTVAGVLYAAWSETDGSHYQIRVKRFDGQNFVSVGGSLNVDPSQDAFGPSIADVGGVPYVAWTEARNIHVRRLDGTSWDLVGGSPNNDDAQAPNIASIGGVPHLGFEQYPDGFVAREAAPVCSGASVAVARGTAAPVVLTCNEGTRAIVSGPQHGTLSALDPVTGTATYTPAPGFTGSDLFSFMANDGILDSNVATVNLNVAAPGGGAVAAVPTISGLAQSHSKFAVGKRPTPKTGKTAAKHRRYPTGTTFSFSLDRAANVRVAIKRERPGRRVGRRCKPRSRKLRHKHKCVRVRRAGTLTRAGHAGANRIAFTGRIGRKALAPARYRAVFTAIDAAGKSTPKTLRFTIVRR
jgi:hypothetical protein